MSVRSADTEVIEQNSDIFHARTGVTREDLQAGKFYFWDTYHTVGLHPGLLCIALFLFRN